MALSAPQATAPRRVHPLSPLAHAGQALPAVLIGVVVLGNGIPLLGRLVLGVLLLAAVGVAGWVSWLRTSFWFDADGDLRVATGLLFRNERRVQLSRLQAVEVQRPFFARLVGLAEVRPEVAGGENAKVRIAFLAEDDAQAVRNELLARAAGIRGETEQAPVAPERQLLRVPSGDLATSMLLNENLIIGALIGGAVIVVTVLSGEGAALLGILIAGGLPGIGLVSGFLNHYDFTIAESPDGLRLRSGLLTTRAQTVPPGRVQALRVSQPLLWRRRGWVRIAVNVAGSGGEDEAGTTLLPVAPWPVARDLLARVIPGVDVEAVVLQPVPPAARRRAWLQYPRLAAGTDADVFVSRGGWLVRRTDVVPHARTQSVRVSQGPWQRALGLATMHVDSIPGPVLPAAWHRDALDARALAEEQLRLARAARRSSRPEHWARPDPAAEEGAP
jgi:putative membrane protein